MPDILKLFNLWGNNASGNCLFNSIAQITENKRNEYIEKGIEIRKEICNYYKKSNILNSYLDEFENYYDLTIEQKIAYNLQSDILYCA